jgi:hypothetical protein
METIQGLSVKLLKTLKKGDSFTSEGFFQGISSTPCVWTVDSVGKDNGAYVLMVSYLGIAVGKFFVRVKKDKYHLEEMAL